MADSGAGKQSKFEMVIGAVDHFSGVFKGFNDRLNGVTADMKRMRQATASLGQATGISRLSGAVSGLAGGMKNALGEGKKLAGTLGGMAGKLSMLFGIGGGGAMALVKGTAGAAAGIGELSRKAGMGVTVFQEYAYAASQFGISNEEMASSLGHLRQMAIDAFKGDDQAQSILRLAGIDPKTAKGEIKSAASLFLELSDKAQEFQAAGRDVAAEDLFKGFFGNDAAKFLPMLQKGTRGLLEIMKEADKHHMFSNKDVEDAKKFNLGLDNLWRSVKGLGFSLGAPLLAPLTKLVDKFSEWFRGQNDMIAGGFGVWIKKLADWVDALTDQDFKDVSDAIRDFCQKISQVVDWFGGWKNVAIAVGAVLAGPFLLSIANLTLAFGKLGLAFATNPLIASGVGVFAKLAVGFAKFGLVILTTLGGVVAKLGGALMPLLPGLLAGLKAVALAFGKIGLAILTTPVGWFLLAYAAIGAAAYAIYKNWDGFAAYFKGLWQEVKDVFSSSWTEGILQMLWNFNPVRLVAKGMNELIAYFTGINFFEIGKKWINQLTGWMPDGLKKFLGITAPIRIQETGGGKQAQSAGKPETENERYLGPDTRPLTPTPARSAPREIGEKLDVAPGRKEKTGARRPETENEKYLAPATRPLSPTPIRSAPREIGEKLNVAPVGRQETATRKSLVPDARPQEPTPVKSAPREIGEKLNVAPVRRQETGNGNNLVSEPRNLNLAPVARSISEIRSERVERQETRVTLIPPEGWNLRVNGPSAGARKEGTSLQIGVLAYGH